MSHNELLASIDKQIQLCGTDTHFECKSREENLPWQVLRAVVEIHKPFDSGVCGCEIDSPTVSYSYPCPTIQAIEKELK